MIQQWPTWLLLSTIGLLICLNLIYLRIVSKFLTPITVRNIFITRSQHLCSFLVFVGVFFGLGVPKVIYISSFFPYLVPTANKYGYSSHDSYNRVHLLVFILDFSPSSLVLICFFVEYMKHHYGSIHQSYTKKHPQRRGVHSCSCFPVPIPPLLFIDNHFFLVSRLIFQYLFCTNELISVYRLISTIILCFVFHLTAYPWNHCISVCRSLPQLILHLDRTCIVWSTRVCSTTFLCMDIYVVSIFCSYKQWMTWCICI